MTPEQARALMRQMRRIRRVELAIAARYGEEEMRCPTHLSVGQEAVAAGVSLALRPTDLAVSGHRAHAHYLAKGGDLPAMLAELYGKATGCARGKGGSMHLIDEAAGFMGSTAIVGGTVPIGVGLALGLRHRREARVSCVFHGDAVVEAGVFSEAVNFAVIHRLPVLFVCENNRYSVYAPLEARQPAARPITRVTEGLGLPSEQVDGNDAQAVLEAAERAVAAVRGGGGPRLIEFPTYRWLEHCGHLADDHLGYRPEAERAHWLARDPIARFEAVVLEAGWMSRADLVALDVELERELEAAFTSARAAPFPHPEAAWTDLYAPPPAEPRPCP